MINRRTYFAAIAVVAAVITLLVHNIAAMAYPDAARSDWRTQRTFTEVVTQTQAVYLASITPVLPGASAPKKPVSPHPKAVKADSEPKAPVSKDKA